MLPSRSVRSVSLPLFSISRVLRNAMSRALASHVERTQDSTRSEVMAEATVQSIEQLSTTVKGYNLKTNNSSLTFKPGQWVDLHIPGETVVGGYSLASPPHLLREKAELCLAIQHSDHPPTLWMSTKCKVGDRLSLRVGGDFCYAPATTLEATPLLLVAGGVGINPLFSMLQHHVWLPGATEGGGVKPVQLLYSARNVSELLFKGKIDQLCRNHPELCVQYFVTKDTRDAHSVSFRDSHSSHEARNETALHSRRISSEDIARAVSRLSSDRLQCFICGPPPMIADIENMLETCGVHPNGVFVEKWW